MGADSRRTVAIDRAPHRFLRTSRHPRPRLLGRRPVLRPPLRPPAGPSRRSTRRSSRPWWRQARAHGRGALRRSGVTDGRGVDRRGAARRRRGRRGPGGRRPPGLSFVDLAWARLGVDPVGSGCALVDGHRFAQRAPTERGRGAGGPVRLALHAVGHQAVGGRRAGGAGGAAAPARPARRAGRRASAGPSSTAAVEPDHLTSLWIPQLAAPWRRRSPGPGRAAWSACGSQDPWKAAQTHQTPEAVPARGVLRGARGDRRLRPRRPVQGADELCRGAGRPAVPGGVPLLPRRRGRMVRPGRRGGGDPRQARGRHPHWPRHLDGDGARRRRRGAGRGLGAGQAGRARPGVGLRRHPRGLPALAAGPEGGQQGRRPSALGGSAGARGGTRRRAGAAGREPIEAVAARAMDPEDALRRELRVGRSGAAAAPGEADELRAAERPRVRAMAEPLAHRPGDRPARDPHPRHGGGRLHRLRRRARRPPGTGRAHRLADPDGPHPPGPPRRRAATR